MPPIVTRARVAFPEPEPDDGDAPPDEWTRQYELLQRHLSALSPSEDQSTPLPLVVQFGSDQCALCPQATLDLDAAKKLYDFVLKYEDATTSTLAVELDVTALPALLVFHDVWNYTLYQKLRGTDVAAIVKEHCPPRLVLDADF